MNHPVRAESPRLRFGELERFHGLFGSIRLITMPHPTTDCIFCKIALRQAPAKIVYEDAGAVAFVDIHPRTPTHLIVIPRKHIESLDALTPEDEVVVGHLHWVAAELARQRGLHRTGYRTVINTGNHAGQSVFHIHLHLMGGRAMAWPPG